MRNALAHDQPTKPLLESLHVPPAFYQHVYEYPTLISPLDISRDASMTLSEIARFLPDRPVNIRTVDWMYWTLRLQMPDKLQHLCLVTRPVSDNLAEFWRTGHGGALGLAVDIMQSLQTNPFEQSLCILPMTPHSDRSGDSWFVVVVINAISLLERDARAYFAVIDPSGVMASNHDMNKILLQFLYRCARSQGYTQAFHRSNLLPVPCPMPTACPNQDQGIYLLSCIESIAMHSGHAEPVMRFHGDLSWDGTQDIKWRKRAEAQVRRILGPLDGDLEYTRRRYLSSIIRQVLDLSNANHAMGRERWYAEGVRGKESESN